MSDSIELYLAQLRLTLVVSPRARRRILWEVEDHLSEAAACEEQHGLSPEAAQRAAIARFGPPQLVAQSFEAEASAYRKQLSSRAFFLALAEFAVLCILLLLLTLCLDPQMQPAAGLNEVVVTPTSLMIYYYVAILCAALLFLEALALFFFSLARAEGVRWYLLSLLPFGLGVWFLLLAQRVQTAYQEMYRYFGADPTSHLGIPPAFFSVWQTHAAQAITNMHTLGSVTAGCILLLLILAWLELRLKPYGKYPRLTRNKADLLNLAR